MQLCDTDAVQQTHQKAGHDCGRKDQFYIQLPRKGSHGRRDSHDRADGEIQLPQCHDEGVCHGGEADGVEIVENVHDVPASQQFAAGEQFEQYRHDQQTDERKILEQRFPHPDAVCIFHRFHLRSFSESAWPRSDPRCAGKRRISDRPSSAARGRTCRSVPAVPRKSE